MAYTQTDLDAINLALSNGTRRVRLNNREIEYHSVLQLLRAKKHIEEELIASAESNLPLAKRRPKAYRARTSKGL